MSAALIAISLSLAGQQEIGIDVGQPQPSRLEVGREVSYCQDRTIDFAYAVVPSVRVEATSILIDSVPISDDDLRIVNGFLNMYGWLDNLAARCRDNLFFLTVEGQMSLPMYELYVGERDGVDGEWTLVFGFTDNRLTDEPDTPQRPFE